MSAVALFIALIACASCACAVAEDGSKICGEKNFYLRATATRWDTVVPDKCSLSLLQTAWTPACPFHFTASLEFKKNEEDSYAALDGTGRGSCMTTENEWQMICTEVIEVPAVGTLQSEGLLRYQYVYPFFGNEQQWSGARGFKGVTGTSKVRTTVLYSQVEYEFHLDGEADCGDAEQFTFAVFGDSPYGTNNADYAQLNATPAFIQTINDDASVQLVAHVGDIHSGSGHCYEWFNWKIYNYWKAFNVPLVYSPGDNEWADCQKAKQGGWTYNPTDKWHCLSLTGDLGPCDSYYDPVADGGSHYPGDPLDNLNLVRRIFFQRPGSTLGKRKSVLSQSRAYDPAYLADAKYVEHVMFEEAGVLFVTLNIPGGSNNEGDVWYGAPVTQRQLDEVVERNAATIRWINRAFDQALAEDTKAVVLLHQANFWHLDGKPLSHLSGYTPIVQAIYNGVRRFGRPVLALHGDSHVYKSDNPFDNTDATYQAINAQYGTTQTVPNFHRVIVHGSTLPMEYLTVTVTPDAYYGYGTVYDSKFGPFTWTRKPQPQVLS